MILLRRPGDPLDPSVSRSQYVSFTGSTVFARSGGTCRSCCRAGHYDFYVSLSGYKFGFIAWSRSKSKNVFVFPTSETE